VPHDPSQGAALDPNMNSGRVRSAENPPETAAPSQHVTNDEREGTERFGPKVDQDHFLAGK
jgi:hypothetical protein